MKKYLMGSSADNLPSDHLGISNEGMYPLVFVDEITKDDLLRAKQDRNYPILIINLIDQTFFHPDKNDWVPMKEFKNYKDQWKEK